MGWDGRYDVLPHDGDMPLAFLTWEPPTIADVMAAAGAGQRAPALGAGVGGGSDYASLGRPPAPGTTFPALGFDPAPGDPAEVARLVAALGHAAQQLGGAHELVRQIAADRDAWQGEAAEAFHARLEAELPTSLDDAHRSLNRAAQSLRDWSARLDAHRARARAAESDAAGARSAYARDWGAAVEAVAGNRDAFALQGRYIGTDAELRRADARIKAAENAVESAVAQVRRTFATLHQAVDDARRLADRHREDAAAVARRLHAASHDLAPRRPNPVLSWIKEHGGDILSAAAAVCGVVALFCPVFAIPAILLSAGALGLHAWKMGSDGAKLWPPSTEMAGNWATLGGDLLGAVPGIGVTAEAAGLMRDAAEAGEAVGAAGRVGEAADTARSAARSPGFAQRWGEAARQTGGDGAVSPLLVRGARRLGLNTDAAMFAGKAFQFNVNATGAAFATAALAPGAADSSSFANANTTVAIGAGAVGGIDAADQLTEIAGNLLRRR